LQTLDIDDPIIRLVEENPMDVFNKSFILIAVFGMLFFTSYEAEAGCTPSPCPDGQTCRYEQPNTYYCKPYNNVQGSQQDAFGQQGGSMSPQSGFNQPSQNNQFGQRGRTPAAAPAQAVGGCTTSTQPCMDLIINNAPYSVSSILAGVELVLKMRLEGQRIFSLSVQPNDASIRLAQAQRMEIDRALSSLMTHRFVEQPNLPEIKNINDLMPPPDFLERIDPMTGSELARLNTMYGYDAMQAAMQEIQRIAKESGGSWAFLALLFSAEAANAVTVVTGTVATAFLIYDHMKEDENKGGGGDTNITVQAGGTLIYQESDNKIIAEKDVNMLVNAYQNLGYSLRNLASTAGMF
jgi:hypothetical protein